MSSGFHCLWLENRAAQNLWLRMLLLITCKVMLQDRHYSRPSSRFYGHFRYTVMLFSSFPVWRAIRINVIGIRRRYVNLTVVNVLVSFKFELWLGYHVNLVKTHYYNSFFLHQKVRMVTSILSWKIVESLGDISKSFAIWSPEVSTRFALSTIFLLYVLELKRILISVTPSAFNILSFPKSVVCVACLCLPQGPLLRTVKLFISW